MNKKTQYPLQKKATLKVAFHYFYKLLIILLMSYN